MKMLFCSNVRIGAICTENLDIRLSHKWQKTRNVKLVELIDKAVRSNAGYVALFGQMFGQTRVSESIIDGLFRAVKDDAGIQTLAFLNIDEYKRISYRNDIPKNLHLFCLQRNDLYADDCIALRINKGEIELELSEELIIYKNEEEKYVISGLPEEYTIPSFEPIGFEDAQNCDFGYGIMEWKEEELGQYTVRVDQVYAYQSIELKIMPEDDQKGILRKINNAVRDVDYNTFLRIIETYDNTVMDIDEEAFENDISLRSEFVRLALQDDSLSESERNRLISCGWNALNGREVSEE